MKFKKPLTIFFLQNSALGINFITQFILTALLPLNTFGSFAKVFVVRDILVPLLSFNIGMSVVYNRTSNKEALIATSTYLSFIQALIIFIGGSLVSIILYFMGYFSDRETLMLLFLILVSLFSVFHTTYYSLFERDEKFIFNSIITLCVSVFVSIGVILVAYSIKSEIPLLLREFIPTFCLFVFYTFLIIRTYGTRSLSNKMVDKAIMKDVINYSWKIYLSRSAEAFLFKLDLLIVSRLFDSSMIGLYERARYFATLPWVLVSGYIHRVHFVKYVKYSDLNLFKRTNIYALGLNFILFIALLFCIYLFDYYSHDDKWKQILILIPFFAAFSIGSLIENYKTLFYAKGNVLFAMWLLRLIPIIIVLFTVLLHYIIDKTTLSINHIALYSSIAYLLPIIFSNKFSNKI